MKPFFTIASSASYDREDVSLRVSAKNKHIETSASFWATRTQLSQFARGLEGFPRASSERLRLRLGDGGGELYVELSCLDRQGHVSVWLKLSARLAGNPPSPERVEMYIQTEAAAIDAFVASLKAFKSDAENEATLQGVSEGEMR